ncbi:MAG: hypothetical protein JST73_08300 [Actinobacteria bacterium]|nr:hypothetical protein [Actinomycetota bacterium]
MTTFVVRHTDDSTRVVDGADAYGPDGTLTTFFATRDGRGVIDSWATRVASFRTAGIDGIERVDTFVDQCDPAGQKPVRLAFS